MGRRLKTIHELQQLHSPVGTSVPNPLGTHTAHIQEVAALADWIPCKLPSHLKTDARAFRPNKTLLENVPVGMYVAPLCPSSSIWPYGN